MKLTSFNCTIEVSKNKNGYSNNYFVDVTDKGVSISHPYVTQTPDQIMFVTKLVHDFIAASIEFNDKIDRFNFDNHLEQYAPMASPQAEARGADFDLDAKSAVPQPSRGGSDSTDLVAHSEQEQERLDMEELEARKTGSDKA